MMQQGRVHFSNDDIGAEILPILTRGLYRDALDSLREYIQNAIDAEATQVQVFIDPDLVSVTDNGVGMNAVEARHAIRLGVSNKNPMVNIGFRGIGIYSGFNLCESLEVFTKAAEESTAYRLHFDFKQIRRELLREQERRNLGHPPTLNLEQLLEESVFMEPAVDGIVEEHGTKVIMSGLLPDVYSRVNDWDQVVDYLQNVVPLPFGPEFRFGETLQEKFEQQDYRVVPMKLQMGERTELLYRPYSNNLFRFGGLHPPEFFPLRDSRQDFAFAWVCVNDARETIKNLKVRGLLIKKFGFSIGDRRYLEPYFGRTVYSRRITGEVIVKHDGLIPNAARSDFENNVARQTFLEMLPKFTRDVDSWANKIQEEHRARDVLSEIAIELTTVNQDLPGLQRDREALLALNARLADVERRLKPHTRLLSSVDPDGLRRSRELLSGCQRFVREALVSQRQTRRRIEREVVKSVQRESVGPTDAEKGRQESMPTDLISLLDNYGFLDSSGLRQFLQYLDDNVLKPHLTDATYLQAITELRDHLEESL